MTDRALLLVPHPAVQPQRAGGMTVLERQLWTLARAGIKQVWIGLQKPQTETRLPPGLEIRWSGDANINDRGCEPPYIAVSGDHFVRVETLRYVAQARYPVSVTSIPGSAEVWIDGKKVGETPLVNHALPAGPHTVWLVLEGVRSPSETVTVAADRPSKVRYEFAKTEWRSVR